MDTQDRMCVLVLDEDEASFLYTECGRIIRSAFHSTNDSEQIRMILKLERVLATWLKRDEV